MLCKYCGAPIKFYDKSRTECDYCGAELFRTEYPPEIEEPNINKSDIKDYNIQDIKVNDIVKDILRLNTYKAFITWQEPVRYMYVKRQVIEGKVEAFTVEFDLHKYPVSNDYYIDIVSEIPKMFDEEDIKLIILQALHRWSYLNHKQCF